MLQLKSSQLERVVERQSRRLQLTESLQDYFALNPALYRRDIGSELPDEWFVPDETETSQSQSSTTTASSLNNSLDSMSRARRPRTSRGTNKSSSLDVTVHRERKLCETPANHTPPVETPQLEPPKTGRRVRWLMDLDPSDGSIE